MAFISECAMVSGTSVKVIMAIALKTRVLLYALYFLQYTGQQWP